MASIRDICTPDLSSGTWLKVYPGMEVILLLARLSFTRLVRLRRLCLCSRWRPQLARLTSCSSASKSSIRRFVITEKAPTRAFSWLKTANSSVTFKTLLRCYAKGVLSVDPTVNRRKIGSLMHNVCCLSNVGTYVLTVSST